CFCFPATATTHTYTLSLHDALPIYRRHAGLRYVVASALVRAGRTRGDRAGRSRCRGSRRAHCRSAARARCEEEVQARRHRGAPRSEEHTSELQSRENLVCRLLLEKK